MSFMEIIVSAENFILIVAQNNDKAMSTQQALQWETEDMLIDFAVALGCG